MNLVRFYLPEPPRRGAIRQHGVSGLGQFLTDAVRKVARENPLLPGAVMVVNRSRWRTELSTPHRFGSAEALKQ